MFPSNASIESSCESWRHVNVTVALTRLENPLWENLVIPQVGVYQRLEGKDNYTGQKLCDQNAGHEVLEDSRKP
jgi:hypothetical protein